MKYKRYSFKCKFCGIIFEVSTWRAKRNPKYCCKNCYSQDMKNTMKGSGNTFFGKHHLQESLNKAVKKRKVIWNDPNFKKEHSRKTSEGMIKIMKNGWKPTNNLTNPDVIKKKLKTFKTDEYKNKRSKISKKLWKNENYAKKQMKSRHVKPNKPEKYIIKIFKSNKIPFEYVGDGELRIDGLCPDFVYKKDKKLIELFGRYWHKEEEISKRNIIFLNKGYSTLFIWEDELNDKNKFLDKVNEFINKSL